MKLSRSPSSRPPSSTVYLPAVLPTKPMSELYGRAQPLGQPVIRIVNVSLDNPNRANSTSRPSMIPGKARSLSVIDNPHVGQATQAIDQRRAFEISFDSLTPCRRNI